LIGGAHAGRGGVVGAGPLPHRPFQRPVLGADQRRHHLQEAFTRRKRREFAEVAALLVAQLARRLHECGAVCRDVGEVPIEAALGHRQVTAQPIDLERFDAFCGQYREVGLDPVVDRQPAAVRAPNPPHKPQPTARATCEN